MAKDGQTHTQEAKAKASDEGGLRDMKRNQSAPFELGRSIHRIPVILRLRQQRLRDAVRRDGAFLLAGAVAYFFVAYVEMHASDHDIRLHNVVRTLAGDNDGVRAGDEGGCVANRGGGILDAGFILTTPIHSYLARHRDVNDALAMWNSIILTLPLAYVVYVTLWKGDFRLSFRLIATHLFRSLCGWFTYLPPDPQFLSSLYDFPEIFVCLFQECSSHDAEVNFLTFFSGHVATIVIVANHLYTSKHTHLSICLHCFNWCQAIRLLATRGHYSIDLIIGYVVAVFVSSPAERLGLYYSRGIQPELPGIVETFEILVGVSLLESRRIDPCASEYESKVVAESSYRASETKSNDNYHHVQSETSVRIAVDIAADIAQLTRE